MELFERIDLILKEKKWPRNALAASLGLPQSTFTRYFCKENQKKLAPYLWDIIKLFPEVRRDWLFFEEGGPFTEYGKPLQAKNARDNLVGDLLHIALEYNDITEDDILRRTGLSKGQLTAVLESRVLPDFALLQQLFNEFGINPAYLFHGNEHEMRFPETALERVALAVGRESRYLPTHRDLEKWFGCSKDEARTYLARYAEGRANVKKYGKRRCEEEGLPVEPNIPFAWFEYFARHAYLNVGWLLRQKPPMLKLEPRTSVREEARQDEVAALKDRLLAAHDANTRLTDELLRLNEERRKLTEQVEWEKGTGKVALSSMTVHGEQSDGN